MKVPKAGLKLSLCCPIPRNSCEELQIKTFVKKLDKSLLYCIIPQEWRDLVEKKKKRKLKEAKEKLGDWEHSWPSYQNIEKKEEKYSLSCRAASSSLIYMTGAPVEEGQKQYLKK